MSSIDEQALRALTDPLFDAVTADGVSAQPPFPLGPDASLSTYYVRRPQTSMTREDFLKASCLDAAEFEQRLAAYWEAAGQPALAARAPLAARAARALHALYREARPDAEVSPYIYQMF